MGNPIQALPISEAAVKEVDLIGVFRYANQYPRAIEMIKTREVDVSSLVSARYSLEHTKEAFEALNGRKGIKIMVTD